MILPLEPRHRPLAGSIEPVQVSHRPLDRIEIHLVVRVAQMIPESTDGAPRDLDSCISASAPSLIAASDISRKHIRIAS